jgi:hypothetical protein
VSSHAIGSASPKLAVDISTFGKSAALTAASTAFFTIWARR